MNTGSSIEWATPEGCSNCLAIGYEPLTFWENLLGLLPIILAYIGIAVTISFLITLGFYLVFRHRNDKNPRKHAIKKSWPLWILVFLVPFIYMGISIIIWVYPL